MLKQIEKKVHKHFHFEDMNEFVIFLVWALFTSAFLLTLVK